MTFRGEIASFEATQFRLACQLLQELLLVHPIFEGFSPVYKDDGDSVSELALELIVGFNVNLTPAKATPAFELGKLFLHDFAKVTSHAGIHDHFAQDGHRAESSKPAVGFPEKVLVPKSAGHKRVNRGIGRTRSPQDGTILPWQ